MWYQTNLFRIDLVLDFYFVGFFFWPNAEIFEDWTKKLRHIQMKSGFRLAEKRTTKSTITEKRKDFNRGNKYDRPGVFSIDETKYGEKS